MKTTIDAINQAITVLGKTYHPTKETEAVVNCLREARDREEAQQVAEIERLRVQLAGCGVAAMQNTDGSKANRVTPDSYGWSASYGDVCNAVDREIALREENERLKAQQVAVPQEQKVCMVPPGEPQPAGWTDCHIQEIKSISAPQPPQAERVPMTEDEIDLCMRLPVGCESWSSAQRSQFMARAIEAHHHIGIKP